MRPGDATPWTGQAHPSLASETLWVLGVAEEGAARHAHRPFELTLDLRWTRSGCTRLFELQLSTWGKDGTRLGRFVHVVPPLQRVWMRPLVRLSRQDWWHLVVMGPEGVAAAVELRNTLDLRGLLGSMTSGAVGQVVEGG